MRDLKALALGLFLTLASFTGAFAQCGTQAPANKFCGNDTGSAALATYKSIPAGALTPIAGGTVLGNPTGALAVPVATTAPVLGIPGTSTGQVGLAGSGSGTAILRAQAAAGSAVSLLPTAAGTLVGTAAAPLAIDAATGQASITGLAGGVLAGAGPAFTRTPVLGASGTLGSLGFGNATSGIVTIQPVAGALGTVTVSLPAASGTVAVSAFAPLALNATTGGMSVTGLAGGVLAGAGPAFTITPVLGVPTASQGSLGFAGATSGTATVTAQATAGSPTLTLPNTSGTFAVGASSPLVLNATTGTLTCPTCVTSSGGGAITGTAPISVSAAGVVSINAPYVSLTANNGGIVYSGATNLAIFNGTATARLPLLSGASTTPQWGAYTLPASVTSGGIGYFSSTGAESSSGLLTANALLLGGGAGGAPTNMGSLGTTTTVLHGNAGGAPTFSAIAIGELPQDSTTWRTATANDTILNTDCLKTVALGGNALFTETLPVVAGFPVGCEVTVKNTDTYTGPGTGRAKRLVTFPTDTTVEGLPQTMLYPQEVVRVKIINGAWVATLKTHRWVNPQTVTLCVDTSGSDSTGDGLVALATAGATCLRTAANAGSIIQKRFDINQATPIIAPTVGQSFTDQLSLGGQPTGGNLIQLSPNGAGTVNWSNAGPCITFGDNAELDLRLNGLNASGNISFTCNTANSAGIGHIYVHNLGILDIEGGPPTFNGAGANDHAIFFDGKNIGAISDGIKVSGTFNYAVNLDQGGKLTHSGGANPSIGIASGAPTLAGLWRLSGASEIILGGAAPTVAGYTSLGPSQINGNSIFIRNGLAAGVFAPTSGGQLCDNVAPCTFTWTPTDASGAGLTFASVSASYNIIGNMVFAYAQLSYPVTANGSNATIGGFPINFSSNNYGRAGCTGYGNAGLLAKLLPNGGAATAALINNANGNITNATLSTATIIFECTYPAQ